MAKVAPKLTEEELRECADNKQKLRKLLISLGGPQDAQRKPEFMDVEELKILILDLYGSAELKDMFYPEHED